MNHPSSSAKGLTSLRRWTALTAVAGAVASALLWVWQPATFWQAYLVAVMFVLGIGLGALAVALLNRLTGGRWGIAVLRELTAAAATVPIMSLLLLPMVFGAAHLYPWLDAAQSSESLNPHQQVYFAPTLWIGRSVVYVVIWAGLGLFMTRGYRSFCRTDKTPGWPSRQRLTAIGLILLWLTTSFAAMDWIMSLEPKWVSTIYGAMITMGFVISGWTTAIMMRRGLGSDLNPDISQDVGNMLLAFLLVWVYLAFSQFLIIWSGNLPHEVTWYERRNKGIWGVVGTLLLLFHFAIPFALLLFREHKRSLARLAGLATALLFMRAVDLAWTILPAFHTASGIWIVAVPLLLATATALWLWVFLWQWQRLPALSPQALELAHPAHHHVTTSQETQTL